MVFDGREQPNFAENPQVVELVRLPQRPSVGAWRLIAIAPVHDQGFGVPDWYQGERPAAFMARAELNVMTQRQIVCAAEGNGYVTVEKSRRHLRCLSWDHLLRCHKRSAESIRLWIADRSLPECAMEA